MIENPHAHFITQRSRQLGDLSVVPEARRAERWNVPVSQRDVKVSFHVRARLDRRLSVLLVDRGRVLAPDTFKLRYHGAEVVNRNPTPGVVYGTGAVHRGRSFHFRQCLFRGNNARSYRAA
jgi:hypothetical protein